MNSSKQIKTFLLDNLSNHQKDIIQAAINRFGISRQAIHKHMNRLIADRKVIAHGTTKGRYYELRPLVNFNKSFSVNDIYSPEEIINKHIMPYFSSLNNNIIEIFEFAVWALLNNICDHSEASKIYYKIYITHQDAHFIINDNGIGIFENIRSGLNLKNSRLAALELAKGHVTTSPELHSGDELNAVIHLFDKVTIDASGQSLGYTFKDNDWSLIYSTQQKGSRIHLLINSNSKRTCAEIFQSIFQKNIKKIRIPLNLLELSENRVVNSRAEAKSILRNIADYKLIEFDFKNIGLIGPSFADTLIRTVREKNQFADIKWINTNKTVDLLMSRALDR